MKYDLAKSTAEVGVSIVRRVVAEQGSIFRPVDGSTDIGIDAFVELTADQVSTGDLVALQIKTGESYLNDKRDHFEIPVSTRHRAYWENLLMPVLLVGVWPARNIVSAASIHDVLQRDHYHGRDTASIRFSIENKFTCATLDSVRDSLALRYRHQFRMLEFIDMAFSSDRTERLKAIEILSDHPAARYSATAGFVALHLLDDEDLEIAGVALDFVGYCVGRRRWSWNPNNDDEARVAGSVGSLCSSVSRMTFRRLFEQFYEDYPRGPESRFERLYDVAACCWEQTAEPVLGEIAHDKNLDRFLRQRAYYMLSQCDDEVIDDDLACGCVLAEELFGDVAKEPAVSNRNSDEG